MAVVHEVGEGLVGDTAVDGDGEVCGLVLYVAGVGGGDGGVADDV